MSIEKIIDRLDATAVEIAAAQRQIDLLQDRVHIVQAERDALLYKRRVIIPLAEAIQRFSDRLNRLPRL
jgi:hypothetical protein